MIKVDNQINNITVMMPGISYFFSSKEGMIKYFSEEKEPSPITEKKFIEVKNIVAIAKEWIGYNFHPNEREQCAAFVRDVITEAGFHIGVSQNPSDLSLLPAGSALAASYANSFAGDDIGLKISKIADLKAGDIVLFKNTYGHWSDGVITHVGIYVRNSKFIHRPSDPKIREDDINSYNHFAEGRRLYIP